MRSILFSGEGLFPSAAYLRIRKQALLVYLRPRLTNAISEKKKKSGGKSGRGSPALSPFFSRSVIVPGPNTGETCGH